VLFRSLRLLPSLFITCVGEIHSLIISIDTRFSCPPHAVLLLFPTSPPPRGLMVCVVLWRPFHGTITHPPTHPSPPTVLLFASTLSTPLVYLACWLHYMAPVAGGTHNTLTLTSQSPPPLSPPPPRQLSSVSHISEMPSSSVMPN